MRNILILATLIPLAYSCATVPKTAMRKDPLIGKIVQGATGEQITYDGLLEKLSSYDVVYLSEKHDNPVHHAVQRRIITDMADAGRFPAVGFEFFSAHDTPLLLNLMDSRKAGHTAEMEKAMQANIRQKLGWEDQSDTMWSFYWDLLMVARDNALTAAGLDLESSQKRRITRKGLSGLTPLEKEQLFSTGFSDPAYKSHMTSIFKDVHCGMSHGRMAEKLYDTWVARNDRMALSITQLYKSVYTQKNKKAGPVVIIMGNGHTEYRLGVMDRVKKLAPDISQVNVAMTEIFSKPAELDAYLSPLEIEGYPDNPPADYIWFTQRVSYEDPCKKFKEALKRMKNQ